MRSGSVAYGHFSIATEVSREVRAFHTNTCPSLRGHARIHHSRWSPPTRRVVLFALRPRIYKEYSTGMVESHDWQWSNH
jgi:hypothetical protein